jgi:hypothetical protein
LTARDYDDQQSSQAAKFREACIRCHTLHVSPKMISRPDGLEADLITRRARARTEGWAGEIEGLDLTLQLLRAKRDDTHRPTQRPTVDLGIPPSARKPNDESDTPPSIRASPEPVQRETTRERTTPEAPPTFLTTTSVALTYRSGSPD